MSKLTIVANVIAKQHLQSEHIAAYRAATDGAIELFTLNQLTHIA